MKLEFENNLIRLANGVDSIAGANAATQFLQQIDDRVIFEDSPFNESKEMSNEIVVRELVKIWRNQRDIQHSVELFGERYPGPKNSNWTLELSRDLWKYGKLSSSNDFFELAKFTELYGEDVDSEEYSSLREMIEELAKRDEPSP